MNGRTRSFDVRLLPYVFAELEGVVTRRRLVTAPPYCCEKEAPPGRIPLGPDDCIGPLELVRNKDLVRPYCDIHNVAADNTAQIAIRMSDMSPVRNRPKHRVPMFCVRVCPHL